jgi:potassium-transporting ATPase potassium-binding subunit
MQAGFYSQQQCLHRHEKLAMNANALIQVTLFLVVLIVISKPLGIYVYRVMEGKPTWAGRVLGPLEYALYRCCRVNPGWEMGWKTYFTGLLAFNCLGIILLYLVLRLQAYLPLNPAKFPALSPDSALNTAISFATNTSWQDYSGETTLGYMAQMFGISSQSFLSAATGIAVLMALLRGFSRSHTRTLGNVWVDLTRSTLYLLLPLSALLAVVLVSQGAIQNLRPNRAAALLQRAPYYAVPKLGADGTLIHDSPRQPIDTVPMTRTQILPMGPVASQTAIALLSGDGGGFFNVNAAHPYANPTPLSNFLEMIAILLIPAALCHTFGQAVGDTRQGWAILAAMAVVFVLMSVIAIGCEQAGNGAIAQLSVNQAPGPTQAGGNMEGKETRFGIAGSALFATVTTSGGDGAVNSMHDSFTPMGGFVPMVLMQLGEVIFGGPGSGLYGMLLYAILTAFIAALLVGRVPEYMGKKIDSFEMKMTSLAILVAPFLALVGTSIAVATTAGRAGIGNPGAHGFSEILYAFSSTANNNGSAFAGLSVNTGFYNVATALAMWFGRFVPLLAILAIAGSLAAKTRRAPGAGTLRNHDPLFVSLLLSTVIVVGSLTYVPALALGPIAEAMQAPAPISAVERQTGGE